MPIVITSLFLLFLLASTVFAYFLGNAHGREQGAEEEASKYKDEIKTAVKEVVVD